MISVGLPLVLSFEHTWGIVMAEHRIRIQVAEFGPQLAQKRKLHITFKEFWPKSSKALKSKHTADLTISVYSYTGEIS